MPSRSPTILLLGATGYTGRLIARELSGGHTPFVLAARDPTRLARLGARLGAGATEVVDVTDAASLRRVIRPGDAVINTVGPFTELGEPVVEACIERQAHYLDTTGEQSFMRSMHERHHEAARRAGIRIVNAMAFEYAFGDCAASLAAEGLATPLRSIDAVYAWKGTASSRGTRRTVIRMLGETGWCRRDGAFHTLSPGAGRRTVRLASGRELHAVAFGSGEVVTVPRRMPVENLRGWMVMGRTAAKVVPLVSPALPLLVPLLRPLLEPLATRAEDPTPRQREASVFTIRIEAEAADGVRRAVEVQGSDPYGLTAIAAVAGARAAQEPGAPTGVLGPAELVDPGPFLASLSDRGLRVVVDPVF